MTRFGPRVQMLLIDVDIDSPHFCGGIGRALYAQRKVYRDRIYRLCRMAGVVVYRISRETSANGGDHWILQVDPLSPLEAVAIQSILGDDPNRSALNLGRVRGGGELNTVSKDWNVLFDKKVKLGVKNAKKD